MNKKALMIIVGSIACGVIAVLLVNFYIRSQEKKLSWLIFISEVRKKNCIRA